MVLIFIILANLCILVISGIIKKINRMHLMVVIYYNGNTDITQVHDCIEMERHIATQNSGDISIYTHFSV